MGLFKKYAKKGSFWSPRWKKYVIFFLLLGFVVSFQNCSWNGSDSSFRGAEFKTQASLGGGETYDGKPEADYIRRVPGYTCGGAASEYGNLNILGDQALLTIKDGEQCSEEKQINTSDLYRSPNTDAVIGYQGGIYTKSESLLSTSSESFTEVWCQYKSADGSQIQGDLVVQWEQAGKMAKGYVFTSPAEDPQITTLNRSVDIHEVRYSSEALSLVVHKGSNSEGDELYVGYYRTDPEKDSQPVECRLGGQFDPSAPQLFYPQSSITFAVDEFIEGFVPFSNHDAVRFQINRDLPEGLVFDEETGRISGEPTEVQRRALYQVTMKFKYGEISTPLYIGTGERLHVTSDEMVSQSGGDAEACFDGAGDCYLRAALSWANNHSEKSWIIDIPRGVYNLDGQEMVVKGNVTIQGEGAELSVFDAQGLSRIFRLDPGAFLELNHVRLVNGRAAHAGGALKSEDATVVIKNSTFERNVIKTSEKGQGAALYVFEGEGLEIYDSQFLENTVEASVDPDGGGIYSYRPNRVIIERSEFKKNYAPFGGALYLVNRHDGLVHLKDNQFVDNEGGVHAGAMYVDEGYIYVESNLFDGNLGYFNGGSLYVDDPRRMKVTNSTFTRNDALLGTAFYFRNHRYDGLSLIKNNRFVENHLPRQGFSTDGKGVLIYVRRGSVLLQDSEFRDNSRHETCKSRDPFDDPVLGFGIRSLGGNTFEDTTCEPNENDVLLE